MISTARVAFAHGGDSEELGSAGWHWDPISLSVIILSAALYSVGLWRLWANAGVGHGVQRWQAMCFAACLLASATALLSPLDRASDIFFSAHMAQHEILMLVAAPLAVLGVPHRTAITALPVSWRGRSLAVLRQRHVLAFWRALSAPLVALGIQIVVLTSWHVPRMFEWALQNEAVHAVQHASFFLAAALFWWALISGRYGRLGFGAGLLFVFMTMLHGGTLGALITFARSAWYPTHAQRTQAIGFNPLEDQQLAGLLMWIPGGVLLLGSALALGAAWLGALERQSARRAPPRHRPTRNEQAARSIH